MNSTSRGCKLVRMAAKSPARWITGPEVARNPTPISRATICASVVLPKPGGPCSNTWSNASPRARAASMNTFKFSRLDCWPVNSASVCGRKDASTASSGAFAADSMRSSSVMGGLASGGQGAALHPLGPRGPRPQSIGPRVGH